MESSRSWAVHAVVQKGLCALWQGLCRPVGPLRPPDGHHMIRPAFILAATMASLIVLSWLGHWSPPSSRPGSLSQSVAGSGLQVDPPGGFAPGRVLVRPRNGASLDPGKLGLDYPIVVKPGIDPLGVLTAEVPVGKEVETVQRLRADPEVEWAELDHLRDLMRLPGEPSGRRFQWNLKKIQAEQAWDLTHGSPDVVVALLDTGIDGSHPDLAGKLVPGYDFLNDDPDPADDSGHGTHNAGIVAAASDSGSGIAGVAWGARVMPIKVLNAGGVGPDSVIARGLVYAVDHGARVINMSFGNPTASQVLAQAVRYAYSRGAVLVAAAGNTANLDNAVIYPAAYDQVLAVGATDEEDNTPEFSQHHPYVGISAPGVGIISTFWRGASYGDYASASGTSSAAPHVSGVAALVLSMNPGLANTDVVRILEETSDDLGVPGRDEYYGAGRVNALRAVLSARPDAAPKAGRAPGATPPPATAPGPTSPAPPIVQARSTWYFAEGSTQPPFDLWLLLQNPNPFPSTARITYMKANGARQLQDVAMAPSSRKSIYVNQVVPNSELSMKVESDATLLAERSMYFRSDGHDSVGAPAPSNRWYMAEGNTGDGFETWILIQNPQESEAHTTITFLTVDGQRKDVALTLPPTSRRSLFVNTLLPDSELSAMVSSDQPVVVERTMYFRQTGGHGGLAASRTATSWYLAEGRVGQGIDSWLLAMNPNPIAATLKVTFMREEGPPQTAFFSIRPWGRLSVYMNAVVSSGRVGARVDSDQPIVVERSSYFAGGRGGTSSVGSDTLSQDWFLPEGSTRQPFTEEIAILNPGDRPARLAAVFMRTDGTAITQSFSINPTSRLTLRVNELTADSEVSARIISDSPVVVERSMYFSNGLGGTSSLGIPR